MSVAVQNIALENIFGAINHSQSQPFNGGSTTFLNGLDTSNLFGGGKSGSTGGTGISLDFTSIGIGLVAKIIPGLDEFIKNGFDFTCLGSQAYDKSNLDASLNDLKSRFERAKAGSVQDYLDFLTWCNEMVNYSWQEIAEYRSGCSKSLNTKFVESLMKVLEEAEGKYKKTQTSGQQNGKSYMYDTYTALDGVAMLNLDKSEITELVFEQVLKPQIIQQSLTNGFNPDEKLNQAFMQLFGKPRGSGSVVVDENGGVGWEVNAGNMNDNTSLYIIGAVVLGAIYMFSKKK